MKTLKYMEIMKVLKHEKHITTRKRKTLEKHKNNKKIKISYLIFLSVIITNIGNVKISIHPPTYLIRSSWK